MDKTVFGRDNLISFFLRETASQGQVLLTFAALIGVLEAVLVCLLAFGVGDFGRVVSLPFALGFLATAALVVLGGQYTLRRVTVLAERAVGRNLLRLTSLARRIELLDFERIGPQRLLDIAGRDLATLSVRQSSVFFTVQNIATAAVVLVVLAVIAPVVAAMLAGIGLIFARSPELGRLRVENDLADAAEAHLLSLARSVMLGLKQLRLDARKRDDLFATGLRPAAAATVAPRLKVVRRTNRFGQMQNAAIYLVAALAAFSANALGFGRDAAVVTFLVLYMTGASSGIVYMVQDMVAGSGAVRRLFELEAELAAAAPARLETTIRRPSFTSLKLAAGCFTYPASGRAEAASIGPIDLELRPGTIIFFAGGNGSGKSTLLKLLTGLYPLSDGQLWLDGRPADRASVRALYAGVFTDFHLFDRPYGVAAPDPDRVDALLIQLGLDGKTAFRDGAFTTTALSTGQRKRLALLVAILEDRPAYVFDEWAADQDPEFRRYFYTSLLPDLKAAGKLVIAATHDDRYFDLCDRLVVMEAGLIRPAPVPEGAG